MAIWLIRAGRHGEDESTALEKGMAVVGWKDLPDVSAVESYEKMKKIYSGVYPENSSKSVSNLSGQVWSFLRRIEIGDIAVLPLKSRSVVAVGKITGGYKYLNGRHVRNVSWIRDDAPRNAFGQDLLYSLGAFMTVCRIKRNNAEERIEAILNGKPDPNLSAGTISTGKSSSGPEMEDEENGLIDLEEQAFDQLRMLIQSKFHGHNLTRLVEAILNVQGYQTYMSSEGPDGGVDILAGHGAMGFDKPRICVEVKSGGVQNDSAVRELEGVMSRVGADQGLFVSMDGFNKTAVGNVRDLFFKLRMWDDKKLIGNLISSYEKLPDEIQAELPLKRIWVVVPEDN